MPTPHEIFFEIHTDLPREGPGDNASTRRAFEMLTGLPPAPRILDIACGPGMQTIHLAQISGGSITAVDTHAPFLDQLRRSAEQAGVSQRISALKMSMFELAFDAAFDVIWCEGAIYIIGVEAGLKTWRPLLKPGGYLAFTEISWLKPNPPADLCKYWEDDYPGMQSVDGNLQRIVRAGYTPVGHFTLPPSTWWDSYYHPIEARLASLRQKYAQDEAAQQILAATQLEMDLHRRYSDWYSYEFYILRG